jgi:hypothetical protein
LGALVVLLVIAVAADSDPPFPWRKFSSKAAVVSKRCALNSTGLPLMHGHDGDGRWSVHSIGITRR